MASPLGNWSPRILSVLRIAAALLFMQHGGQKLFDYPAPGPQEMEVLSLPWIAGMLELFGGLLLALGAFTRPVALVLAVEMAVAYFKAHAPRGAWPLLNGGELALLYCFLFLYLASAGGGAWSVDAARSRPRAAELRGT